MHFVECKLLYFDSTFTEICSIGPKENVKSFKFIQVYTLHVTPVSLDTAGSGIYFAEDWWAH